MNGIIHVATKSDNSLKPKNEDEVIKSIYSYIDQLFSIVRPRQLLYMAIDGVAPRAKLQQQRSRRFLSLKDALEIDEEIKMIKARIAANGNFLPENQNETIEYLDESCITAGTSFMTRLTDHLRDYIYNRLHTNPAWSSIKVILSGVNVPGEGEHKIINYIRQQRAQSGYNNQTKHVVFGTDADLILLGLGTHEHHITIMRDELNLSKPRVCDICGQLGHDYQKCEGLSKENLGQHNNLPSNANKREYIFVHLSMLRGHLFTYFQHNFQPLHAWDFERFFDDWVFLCLIVGNDFLPTMLSFEIYQNAIDDLLSIYLLTISNHTDYLTNYGDLNLTLLKDILIEFGRNEDNIFKNRHEISQQWQATQQSSNISTKPSVNIDEYVHSIYYRFYYL